jgi:hypothetical protein
VAEELPQAESPRELNHVLIRPEDFPSVRASPQPCRSTPSNCAPKALAEFHPLVYAIQQAPV